MSRSKHIDKICIAAIAVTLIITILFMNGSALGIISEKRSMGYEERLFDTSTVHRIDIVMNDWDTFITNCETEEYSLCNVAIDGKKLSNVALRAKGNTSLSSVSAMNSQRYSFKLEFDHYDSTQTYYGLDKLCLNNLIQDNTMMKDYIAYTLMASFGVDTPLCSYVYITVNGEDWGLYLAVEGVEDSFLQRNYGANPGNLYKPDSLSFGAGRGNGEDFDMGQFDFGFDAAAEAADSNGTQQTADMQQASSGTAPTDGQEASSGTATADGQQASSGTAPTDGQEASSGTAPADGQEASSAGEGGDPPAGGFDIGQMFGGFNFGSDDVKLKYIDDDPESYPNIFDSAKTEISAKDKETLIASLKNLTGYTDLEDTVDVDEVIRYFVVHNFLVNGDSYTGNMIHNYYLHEQDGILSMIPWDYNLAYGTFQGGDATSSVNNSITNPVSDGVDDRPMLGWIFSDEQYTEQYYQLFDEFIREWIDSGKLENLISDTAEMIRDYVEKDPTKFCTLEDFDTAIPVLTEFVKLRGEAVFRQLNGDSTSVDCSGLNLSDLGTMNGTGGGGDFDAGCGGDTNAGSGGDTNAGSGGDTNAGSGGDTNASSGGDTNAGSGGDTNASSDGDNNAQAADSEAVNTQAPSANGNSAPTSQMPQDTVQPDNGGTAAAPEGSGMQPPDFAGGENPAANGQSAANQLQNYLYFGVSIAVLLFGIIFAIKMKRHK